MTKIYLFFALTVIAYFSEGCPNIIKRSEWEAQPPKSKTPLRVNPPPFVVIHHSDGQGCDTLESCKTRVLAIQNYHMINKGWEDIGYNFLVGGDGNVYEGRGWGVFGSHVPKYNARSLGICVVGKFIDKKPSSIQLAIVKQLIECAKNNNYITKNYHLIGHRQGSKTDCPGDKLFQEISSWQNFDSNPSPLNV